MSHSKNSKKISRKNNSNNQKKADKKEIKKPSIVKNVEAVPLSVPNDGSGELKFSCTAFTSADKAGLSRVWADLRHTFLFEQRDMAPVPGRIFPHTREGDWELSVAVPRLLDPGPYEVPVRAEDELGGMGEGVCRFDIEYKRKRDLSALGAETFFEELERLTQARFTGGNHIRVLQDGPGALQLRLDMIQSAQKQINIQTYTMGHAGAGGVILDALLEKADQGVEVNVILNADTQFPTSTLSTIRLKVNEFLTQWVQAQDQWEEQPEWLRRLLGVSASGGVHLLLFSKSPLKEKQVDGDLRPPDHWLRRILNREQAEQKERAIPTRWLASYDGPGGLPALPLLDFAIHEKILVVDGEKAIIGGRNLEDRYFEHWHDLDVYLEGPVVHDVQGGFLHNFLEISQAEGLAYRPQKIFQTAKKPEGARALFAKNRPWSREYQALWGLVHAVECARESIWIYSQYVVLPESLLRDALMDAAHRGLDIRVITNSAQTGQEVSMAAGYYLTLNYLEPLIAAGMKFYKAKGNPDPQEPQPYLHAKEFLFDDRLAAMGSFNLSIRSSYMESENILFVPDRELCLARRQVFEEFQNQHADPISMEDLLTEKENHKGRMEMASVLELLF